MKRKQARIAVALATGLALAVVAHAQAPTRVVGSVMAISGRTLTVKPDNGARLSVTVSDTARILRAEPGARSLAGATPIQFTDLSVGDRILALVQGDAASTVIAMKRTDIAKAHGAEAADWQRRGTGGLVKSVDAAAGLLTINSGIRVLTVRATPQTVVRRYGPDSAQFADSVPSTLAQIHLGDQLRVLGSRNADGTEITAEEIVAGSFRNIAGIVLATRPADNTLTVRDLVTKKPVVIRITAESQLHKLPPDAAMSIAARLGKLGTQNGHPRNGEGNGGQAQPRAITQNAGTGQSSGDQSSVNQSGGDLSQMLARAPAIALSSLRKGDAVMIVATQGTPASVTAVTLLAGVEPILSASPSGNQNVFSASWNLGGGGTGAAAGGGEESPPQH